MNLVQIEGTETRSTVGEVLRITASMVATCAVGALILSAVFIGTNRYQVAARARAERAAVTEMLGLDANTVVLPIHQFLDAAHKQVVYRTAPGNGARGEELVFTLDGALVRRAAAPAGEGAGRGLAPLGRIFLATRNGALAGFVTEGESQGYKNRIRFFVALDANFDVAGVRVIEHEEDPGLGAEVATRWFQGQYTGRKLAELPGLDVTRDPMPEDWRSALRELESSAPAAWRGRFVALQAREHANPVYAVTGATISSRALTNGVRSTAHHFARRWSLLAPHLGVRP